MRGTMITDEDGIAEKTAYHEDGSKRSQNWWPFSLGDFLLNGTGGYREATSGHAIFNGIGYDTWTENSVNSGGEGRGLLPRMTNRFVRDPLHGGWVWTGRPEDKPRSFVVTDSG